LKILNTSNSTQLKGLKSKKSSSIIYTLFYASLRPDHEYLWVQYIWVEFERVIRV